MKCKFENLCEYEYCKKNIECYYFEPDIPQNVEDAVTCIDVDICKNCHATYLEYDSDYIYITIYDDIDIDKLCWDKLDQFNLSNIRISICQKDKKMIIKYK